jgi:hypothetical protein
MLLAFGCYCFLIAIALVVLPTHVGWRVDLSLMLYLCAGLVWSYIVQGDAS